MSNAPLSNSTLSMLENSSTASSLQAGWLLHPDLHQVTLGTAWVLLCIIGLAVNAFICVYTVVYMCKKKTSTRITTTYTSQSSLLLFNFSLAFVLESLVGLPFVVVATTSGEWMIGVAEDIKEITCAVSGFALHWGYTVSLHTLAVISVERFLFVSKPHIHKTKFTNKVMLIVITAIWIYCFVLSTTPYYGLGGYSFYRQGGVCIARLPPESWWLVLYIVYSTVPIMLLMAMIMATFAFASRFARRQQKSAKGPGSKSRVGVNNKVNISRTLSTLEEGSSNLKQVNYTATAEYEGKNQSRPNCCCFSGRRCFTIYGVFGALVVIYSIQLMTGTISSIITIPTGIDFQPAPLQATSTYLTTALPLLTGVIQVYFRPEFRKLITWVFKKLACRRLLKKPWSSTSHPQRSHASQSHVFRDQEGRRLSSSMVTNNGNELAIVGSLHGSHSRNTWGLPDTLKDNQDNKVQIVNEGKSTGDNGIKEQENEERFDEQKPKRFNRFFSQVAQREDSEITITDVDSQIN